MKKKILKYFVGRVYKPILAKYLSGTRSYRYKGISLVIPPQVFHPAFFFSTKLLLKHLDKGPLQGKSFLELGAGSGLIAFYAAKKGASVTATDINPVAVEYLQKNRQRNNNLPLRSFYRIFSRQFPGSSSILLPSTHPISEKTRNCPRTTPGIAASRENILINCLKLSVPTCIHNQVY